VLPGWTADKRKINRTTWIDADGGIRELDA
jgi:hypothetical protein